MINGVECRKKMRKNEKNREKMKKKTEKENENKIFYTFSKYTHTRSWLRVFERSVAGINEPGVTKVLVVGMVVSFLIVMPF